jgi:PAS domain S-box-containing protein
MWSAHPQRGLDGSTIVAWLCGGAVGGALAWRIKQRTELESAAAERRFEHAFDSASVGMAVVALDGRWLEINLALCNITGYSEAELLGKTFQDITHPDDLERDLEQARRLVAGHIGRYQLEKRYVRADGGVASVLLSVTLVRDSKDAPQYFVAQIEDVTESRRAEAYLRRLYESQRSLVRELEEAHRLKSELFNIVSHEFKTPLASIIGFTGLLAQRNDRLSDEHREKYLETIARQAERLNRLVENLFTSARDIRPSRGANASIQDAIDAVRAQLSDTYDDVGFDIAIASGLRPRISPEALRLVLLNLASNAVKHAAPNTAVEVRAHRDAGDVVLAVSNEGAPIPADVGGRIFEPFVQSVPSGRTADGVGLGLHIVAKLVTAHGGSVELENAPPKVTFTIRLPEVELPDAHLDLTEAHAPA